MPISSRIHLRGPAKKCERCGLSRVIAEFDTCPHCSDLDDSQLTLLLDQTESDHIKNAALGRKLFVAAVISIFILVLYWLIVVALAFHGARDATLNPTPSVSTR